MTATIVLSLLLLGTADAEPTEVLLKDGQKLVGVVKEHDEAALVMIIPLGGQDVGIGGSVRRPVRWTEIESIDGMSIKEWLEWRAEEIGEPEAAVEPEGPLLERFETWIGSRSGMKVSQSIGAIVLLILLPALVLHQAGKLMGMRELEPVRSMGGAMLALGAAWAALRIYPGWAAGVPWVAVGGIGILLMLTMRPTLGRWILLTVLESLLLLGLVAAILSVARLLP